MHAFKGFKSFYGSQPCLWTTKSVHNNKELPAFLNLIRNKAQASVSHLFLLFFEMLKLYFHKTTFKLCISLLNKQVKTLRSDP